MAGCLVLVPTECVKKHNNVAGYTHRRICDWLGFNTAGIYYDHVRKKVTTNRQATPLWDFTIITDRKIASNRRQIVLHDEIDKTCLLTDDVLPDGVSVPKKKTTKTINYKEVEIAVSRMWGANTRVTPVVVGALGTIGKGFCYHLNRIPGNSLPTEV